MIYKARNILLCFSNKYICLYGIVKILFFTLYFFKKVMIRLTRDNLLWIFHDKTVHPRIRPLVSRHARTRRKSRGTLLSGLTPNGTGVGLPRTNPTVEDILKYGLANARQFGDIFKGIGLILALTVFYV